MEQQNKGIVELSQMLDGLAVIAIAAKKVMADGKVDLKDLSVAMNLVSDSTVLLEAIKGASEIPAEVKDLSMEEIQMIVAKVLAIASQIKAS